MNETPLVLRTGTIYTSPDEQPIHHGVVVIEAGKVSAVGPRVLTPIPQAARTLDCSACTITAGFWNSHVHFFERKWADAASIPREELTLQLQDMLTRFGFTSVFDIGSMWENTRSLRNRIESGEASGPRIRTAGPGLVPPGALPPDIVINMMGCMKFDAPEIADASQAANAARKLLDQGVDAIKVFLSSPRSAPLSADVIEAAANEAHRSGKLVFAHPNTGADVLTATRGGVDIIAHTTPHTGAWDDAMLTAMRERRMALTPTLTIWKWYARHDRLSSQRKITNTEIDQLRAWLACDGDVLFGNDLGAVDYDPREEYLLMSEAGMSFPQILASLTTKPAERFGESEKLGRIAPGFEADLVVLNGDPSKDIRALTSVQHTLRSGEIIYSASKVLG
jgi:imidazolonepropionase-like amidohydrolase